ncbi:MAG: hypothetical protein M3Y64_07660 [Gemmatimonadota bacterium]|nr:hypothetical protein [Gemmatimonadota bacterium]
MRRKPLCVLAAGFCALVSSHVLAAQPIPARDLWQFPLGAVLEPAAVAVEAGTGLWNPASVAIESGTRFRFGVAKLSANQGVDGYLLGGAWRRESGTTFGISVAQTSVDGLVRTETEPLSSGSINYSSTLLSASLARQVVPHVTLGIAARYRDGRTDQQVGSAVAGDVGLLVDSLPWHSLRIALSSFLWRPGHERDDQPAFLSAIDARVFANPASTDLRVGYQRNVVKAGSVEQGPFASTRVNLLQLRAAYVITTAFGHSNSRVRSGLALFFSRYTVGIGREEGAGGLGPLYQFTLSSSVK